MNTLSEERSSFGSSGLRVDTVYKEKNTVSIVQYRVQKCKTHSLLICFKIAVFSKPSCLIELELPLNFTQLSHCHKMLMTKVGRSEL